MRRTLTWEEYWALRQCGVQCVFECNDGNEWPDAMFNDVGEKESRGMFNSDVSGGSKYTIDVE